MARPRKAKTLIALELILRPILAAITKRQYRGIEKLPKSGGYVIAANHNSHIDPLLLARFVLDAGLVPRYLAKESLFDHWFMKRLVIPCEQIPVGRYTDRAKNALEPAENAIREGKQVIIYPEGTITRDPAAWPMTGRTGAVRVALTTGCQLIPVCQNGAQDVLWPYTLKFRLFPRKKYTIEVGEPMDLSMYAGKPITEEILHEATNRLMDTLTEMMIEIRGEQPTGPRIDVHTVQKHTTVGKGAQIDEAS
jgi:1-acyl-sn-glycerol-3-phosphate acyltransferase